MLVLKMFELCCDYRNFSEAKARLLDFQRTLLSVSKALTAATSDLLTAAKELKSFLLASCSAEEQQQRGAPRWSTLAVGGEPGLGAAPHHAAALLLPV